MKKTRLTLVLVCVLTIQAFSAFPQFPDASAQAPNVYIGIDVAYGGVEEAKAAIDRANSFTNLLVFGSTQVTWFPDRINETFQYAHDKGLSIIALLPAHAQSWYETAQSQWVDKLLGFYILDELGGKQLDGKGTYVYIPYTGPVQRRRHAH